MPFPANPGDGTHSRLRAWGSLSSISARMYCGTASGEIAFSYVV